MQLTSMEVVVQLSYCVWGLGGPWFPNVGLLGIVGWLSSSSEQSAKQNPNGNGVIRWSERSVRFYSLYPFLRASSTNLSNPYLRVSKCYNPSLKLTFIGEDQL